MMEMKQMLLNKIADRKIVAGIVGLGYVGLPLAVEKAKAGFRTIGFDLQDKKVEMVNAGHNYFMVKKYGAIGAAWATLFTVVIASLCSFPYLIYVIKRKDSS